VLYPALLRLARVRHGAAAGARTPEVPTLQVDVLKLPHHGSQANVLPELFDVVRADHCIVSTNGDRFHHPDDEAMARVITRGGPGHTIWFNYRSERTEPWDDAEWKQKYGYDTSYPGSAEGGVTLRLAVKGAGTQIPSLVG
jgi:hypothetical protein